jgi:hypothetical protein
MAWIMTMQRGIYGIYTNLPIDLISGSMTKYRRLHLDELEKLEQEFVRFLAAQSITAADYREIMVKDPEKQLELIDQFSDVVFTKTLSNIKILKQKTPNRLVYYTFFEDHAELYGFELIESLETDLNDFSYPEQIIQYIHNNPLHINWLKGTKTYRKDKFMEIFELLENNCLIVQEDALYYFIRQKFEKAEQ